MLLAQRGQALRRQPHKSQAPPTLARTAASAAKRRAPLLRRPPPTIQWRSILSHVPESFALRLLASLPAPCALRSPACVALPHKPVRHRRRCTPAPAPARRTRPTRSSAASGPPRLSPSTRPSHLCKLPVAADLPTPPRLQPF